MRIFLSHTQITGVAGTVSNYDLLVRNYTVTKDLEIRIHLKWVGARKRPLPITSHPAGTERVKGSDNDIICKQLATPLCKNYNLPMLQNLLSKRKNLIISSSRFL